MMRQEENQIDISNHPINLIASVRMADFMRRAEMEMYESGFLEEFQRETQKCLRSVINFYDLAMENPRAAKIALNKLRSKELLSDQNPDELKSSLIEATKVVRERRELYQEQGENFSSEISRFCIESFSIAKREIEQRLQQEQDPNRPRGILKDANATRVEDNVARKSISFQQGASGGIS